MERMLATDLDGTFIGDDAAMEALWGDLEDAGFFIAFSTGRHLPSIEGFYARVGTPRRADACVTMVGTEIWHRRGDAYVRDDDWSEVISERWDKAAVEAIVAEIPGAEIQPEEWQSPFKSSYYLEGDVGARLEGLAQRLDEQGLAAKVVYSAGRFLDLLPVRSGKGEAVRYLADEVGIAPENVITAGDSGNDLDMMRPELGFRCIAVGNASSELAEHSADGLYHAEGRYAAGVREGLEHFGWLERHGS
jgi:sucrose-6F-phosphate phosphohydrolase